MGEIKFRGITIEPLASGETWIYTDDEMPEIYLNHADKLAYINMQAVSYDSVTQCTGLKDKNGQDIYEGDVLYIKEKGRWGGEYIAPVEWLEWDDRNVVGGDKGEHWAFYGIVCTTVKEISHHKEVKSLFTRGFLTRRFGSCIQLAEMTKDINRFEIKVIGNIFENPELLEDVGN